MKYIAVITTWFPSMSRPTHCIFNKYIVDELAKLNTMHLNVISPIPYLPVGIKQVFPTRYSYLFSTPRIEKNAGYEVFYPRYLKVSKASVGFQFRSILKCLKKMNRIPDIIYSHGLYPDGMVALKLKETLGIPVVLHIHQSYFPYSTSLANRILNGVDAVIVVSAHQKKLIMDKYSPKNDNITIVPN